VNVCEEIILLHTNSPIIVRFSPRITYIPTRFSQYRLSTTTNQQTNNQQHTTNKLLNESRRVEDMQRRTHVSYCLRVPTIFRSYVSSNTIFEKRSNVRNTPTRLRPSRRITNNCERVCVGVFTMSHYCIRVSTQQ